MTWEDLLGNAEQAKQAYGQLAPQRRRAGIGDFADALSYGISSGQQYAGRPAIQPFQMRQNEEDSTTKDLVKAMILEKVKSSFKPKTYKEQAMEAIAKGETIPGLTPEQTQKAAGVYIPAVKSTINRNEDFNRLIQEAVGGQLPWEDLKRQFPEKLSIIERAQPHYTPVTMSKDFRKGTGTPVSRVKSFFSGSQAEIEPSTMRVIQNIENQYDLNEFLKNIEDYANAGVDTKAILEYFGVK